MTPQWIGLDGTENTRDLGGIPTAAGTIASGIIVRSDNLQDLTAGDLATLDQLTACGVTLVLDLRTPGEVELEGSHALDAAGVRHEVLSFVPDPDAALRGAGKVLPDRTGHLPSSTYLGYLRDMPDNVVKAVRLLAHTEGTAIVHCAAGKDRTGVLCAMVLDVAGAPREAIVADYLATADVIAPLMARLAGTTTYSSDLAGRDLSTHVPRAENIEVFLHTLDADWGSEVGGGAEGWLLAHGLSASDLGLLRSRLS